jgi:hypothetical protein
MELRRAQWFNAGLMEYIGNAACSLEQFNGESKLLGGYNSQQHFMGGDHDLCDCSLRSEALRYGTVACHSQQEKTPAFRPGSLLSYSFSRFSALRGHDHLICK